ncbi:MAG: sigma-E processing peptidase SpoIIGA [Clostridia bacterium]|nr:sigma-E processing peptidase SpoIIGA [Clostridia bacterium]
MKEVIYIDVLIAVNLFINYFLIISTAKFLHLKTQKLRLILGEILGGIYSLYILLPPTNFFVSLIIKFLMAASIILTAFKFSGIKIFFKTLICFYLINFAFSGVMLALWCTLRPNGMAVNNGIVYFAISPVILVISTVITYLILQVINRIIGKRSFGKSTCNVKIIGENSEDLLTALIDTGNSLVEPFSGLPVIVVKRESIKNICPEEILSAEEISNIDETACLNSKLRMIPFKTISGEGLLPSCKPKSVIINGGAPKEAYVAVCSDNILSENCSAIINSDLIT